MFIKAPCQYCEKRKVGCRSSCEPWQEYEQKRNKDYEDRFKRNAEQEAFFAGMKLEKKSKWSRSGVCKSGRR